MEVPAPMEEKRGAGERQNLPPIKTEGAGERKKPTPHGEKSKVLLCF
jgi:hypothetical protein